jgi:hypothetical protein
MSRVDLERRARDARDMAMCARRLAQGLSQAADRERFNRFADEEDERAAGLEAEAAALRPISPMGPAVAQQQLEQQQETVSPGPPKPKPGT